MTTKRIERELPVRLTDKLKEERLDELPPLINERTALETELAAFTTEKRKRLREIKKSEKEIAAAVDGGVELRMVWCEERMIFSTNTIEVIRLDTKEVVERRPMTIDERQTAIDVDPKAKKTRVKKGDPADATH